jgi:hypothetical protein
LRCRLFTFAWSGKRCRCPTAPCGDCQGFGEATHGEALVPERCGLLLLLWIERPPLSAANTASIHQCRWTA